jgi:uncharacterized membrane protein
MPRIVFVAVALAVMQSHAAAMDRMQCFGTEPFWNLVLTSDRIAFSPAPDRKLVFAAPRYSAARGTSPSFVMNVAAKKAASSLVAFIINETMMEVRNTRGKDSPESDAYRAYCADGMSVHWYSLSIHLLVDGIAYTGCCTTAALPSLGSD